MIKCFLVATYLFFSISNGFHQPDLSTTVLAEQEDGTWVLQIRAALTAFEYEVHAHYGKDSYATPEEFNALVVRHLTDHISISCNGDQALSLQRGAVKLGHETVVLFEIQGIPQKINKLLITNSSFEDIHDNQSALVILKKDFKKQQFKLNNQNAHTAQLKVSKNQFELK